MNNVELIKQGYQYFAEGNIEAVLAIFHPEIEWNACKGLPFIPGDGLIIGPDAIVQNVFAQTPEHLAKSMMFFAVTAYTLRSAASFGTLDINFRARKARNEQEWQKALATLTCKV